MKNLIAYSIMALLTITSQVYSSENQKENIALIECFYIYADGDMEQYSKGSGALITPKGHILTSAHIIEPHSLKHGIKRKCEIYINNKVFNINTPTYISKNTDVAIIKINQPSHDFNNFSPICSSKEYIKQEDFKIYGYPLDKREPILRKGSSNKEKFGNKFWHIEAEVVPGMSGSPIFYKNNIIGIIAGGEPSTKTYNAMLPEEEFSAAIKDIQSINYCPCQPPTIDLSLRQDCGDCPKMIGIPSGRYMRGSPVNEAGRNSSEGPQTEVTIEKFFLSQTEVTLAQFKAFARETNYQPGSDNKCRGLSEPKRLIFSNHTRHFDWLNPGFNQTDEHPAVCINYFDALAYIEWLNKKFPTSNYRLPTEAEWEYAARGHTKTASYWGDDTNNVAVCRFENVSDTQLSKFSPRYARPADCNDGYKFTAPVQNYCPNPFGLYDMLGNVQEWVADCSHGSYENAPTNGTPWFDMPETKDCKRNFARARRSAHFSGIFTADHNSFRAAARSGGPIGFRGAYVGFRVAADY